MAQLESSGKKKKRKASDEATPKCAKTPRTQYALEEEKGKVVMEEEKTLQGRHVWKHLDLVLSLESKEIHLQRKIELAFGFVSSLSDTGYGDSDWVPLPRLVSYLNNWIQSALIHSEKNEGAEFGTDGGITVAAFLDCRCWKIFKFCLTVGCQLGMPLSFSPHMLRVVASVVQSMSHPCQMPELLALLSDSVFLIFSSYARSLNANVDTWTSLCAVILDLVHNVLMSDPPAQNVGDFLRFSILILEPFANYLKVHPSPKNIFPIFVDKLFELSLQLLNMSNIPLGLLKIVEEILSNGLFHQAHLEGFLGIRSSEKYVDSKDGANVPKVGLIKSYHKHLFQKLEHLSAVKKRSLGHLLLLFVNRVKKYKEVSLASESGKRNSEANHSWKKLDEETSRLSFEMFVQLMEHLMPEIKRFSDLNYSVVEEVQSMLSDALYTFQSVSRTLMIFMGAKLYARTKDTPEGGHYNFLKEVYNTVILFASKVYSFMPSALEMNGGGYLQKLLLIIKEVIVVLSYFTEIEYKVLENDLTRLWILMLSYQAVDQSLVKLKGCCSLSLDILQPACKFINIYSELRQVAKPIYALCKAVRIFGFSADNAEIGPANFVLSGTFLSSKACLRSVTALVCSQEFRLAISAALRSLPEGQVGGFIHLLKNDITGSLEWAKISLLQAERKEPEDAPRDSCIQAELLGTCFSELYTLILDSSNVTVGNGKDVGNCITDLMECVRPIMIALLDDQTESIPEFTWPVFSHQKMFESSNKLWIYVLFFQLYISCRSLYRQVCGLMTPTASRKASIGMGDPCTAYVGQDWQDLTAWEDEGYFSWIVKPSVSLLDMIQCLQNSLLADKCLTCAPLIYVLSTMSIQRLVDLNRHIRVLKFLQERDANLGPLNKRRKKLGDMNGNIKAFKFLQARDATVGLLNKNHRRWRRALLVSKQEAAALTEFLIGHLNLILKRAELKLKGSSEDLSFFDENDSWNLCVSSVTAETVLTALWWLMCKNIDVWCAHASKKDLKKFLSVLFQHSLPYLSKTGLCDGPVIGAAGSSGNITQHLVSLELLGDTLFCEQRFLHRHLKSRLCKILKKTLAPIVSSDTDFNILAEWSKAVSILQSTSITGMSTKHGLSQGTSDIEVDSVPALLPTDATERFSMNLVACQSVLNLFCWMSRGFANSRYLSECATYILNVERFLVPILLGPEGYIGLNNRYELFKLFVCCRRSLRYIALKYSEDRMECTKSPLLLTLFDDSCPIIWLLISLSALVGVSSAFHECDPSILVNDLVLLLIDHTSHIFYTLGELQSGGAGQSFMCEQIAPEQFHEDDQSEAIRDENTSVGVKAWKCVELTAVTLKEQTESLFCTLKNDSQTETPIWHRVSALLSCVHGFLWGQVSALQNIEESGHLMKDGSTLCAIFERRQCMNVFEDFVNYCLHLLIVDESREPGNSCPSAHGEVALAIVDESELHCLKKLHGIDSIPENSGINVNDISSFTKETNLIESHTYKKLRGSLLLSLLKGENPEIAYSLRLAFSAYAAILQLRNLISSWKTSKEHSNSIPSATATPVIVLRALLFMLTEFAEMDGRTQPFSLICLDGAIKYLEALGNCFPYSEPVMSRNLYAKLIDIHLSAIGKCIVLQGRAAKLASFETESNTKTLEALEGLSVHRGYAVDHVQYSLDHLKATLRLSFKTFVKRPLELHLLSAVQALERALVGFQGGCNVNYGVSTGTINGGKISSRVAAGVECLDLVLESIQGSKRLNLLKRHIQSLIGTLLNIIVHLQGPQIFWERKLNDFEDWTSPDPGSVILMCVEVLTKIAGKHILFPVDPSHVAHLIHLPSTIFKHFLWPDNCQDTASPAPFSTKGEVRHWEILDLCTVDHHYSVALFAASCRLLWTVVRHRKSEYEKCVSLLEDSVCQLVYCLETVDIDLVSKKQCFGWKLEEGIKCASFLRRIYEEIRHQKDVLGQYSFYFLSNYILVYSGLGPLKSGIRREIDEALRPGLYALIDVMSPDDLQRLHTVLGEGTPRSTLAALQHDYKFNFQYEGKV